MVKLYASTSRLVLTITGSCNIICNAKNKKKSVKDAVKFALSSFWLKQKHKHCRSSFDHYDVHTLHTLNALLKKERLAVTEVELFKAVLKWTDSECARQGINIEEDKTARRRILGDRVYEIPFLAMSQGDIARYVSVPH